MVDNTLEAFGLTREQMEEANQRAADQMLPMPYDIPGEVAPVEENRFGDTAAWAAKDSWEEAKARFQARGTEEGVAGAIPEVDSSVLNTFAAGLGYAADMGLSGLAASDAAWKYSVGLTSELIPGMDKNQERRFTRDVSSIPEAFAGNVTGVVGAAERLPTLGQAVTGARIAGEQTGDVLEAVGRRLPQYDPTQVNIFGGLGATRPGKALSGEALPESVGADGLYRFEIDDSNLKVNPQVLTRISQNYEKKPILPEGHSTLGSVLEHSELFSQYPDLLNTPVVINELLPSQVRGGFYPDSNVIVLSQNLLNSPEELKRTLLHETQHIIQEKENFVSGTSPADQENLVFARGEIESPENIQAWKDYQVRVENYRQPENLRKPLESLVSFYEKFAKENGYALREPSAIGSFIQSLRSKKIDPVIQANLITDFQRVNNLLGFLPEAGPNLFGDLSGSVNTYLKRAASLAEDGNKTFTDTLGFTPEAFMSTKNPLEYFVNEPLLPERPAPGTSPIPYDYAFNVYERRRGEVEARNAAARSAMTLAERFGATPEQTERTMLGVTRDSQWGEAPINPSGTPVKGSSFSSIRDVGLGNGEGPEFEGLPPLTNQDLKEWPEQAFLAHEPEHFSMLNLPERDIERVANAYESYLISSSPESVKALEDSLESQVAVAMSGGKNPLDPEYLNTLVKNASKEKDLALEKLQVKMMGDALVEGAFMETVGPLVDERVAVMDPKGNLKYLELGEWAWVENKVREAVASQPDFLTPNSQEPAGVIPVSNANLDSWAKDAYFKDVETGRPQVMYHGMSGNLRGQPVEFSGENLEPSSAGTLGPGTYLTRDPSVASDFAVGKRGGYTDEKFGGQVFPVYTNVTRVVDDEVINSNKDLRSEVADLIEEGTDDPYLFNLAEKLRGDDNINLSSLFTKVEDGKVRSTGVGSLISSLLESKGYEGISVITDKGFHEAVIFPGHGGLEFPRQNIKSSLQGPEGQYSRESNDMRFAKGGLAMERQMNRMMAEGGIKDDGMNKDPISGNEVPPGSLAKEVRDDVDAKLSEGEYVVPADVVRFFGVSYFEKLRDKAKAGLQKMDEDGRIGGDPVPMDDDFPFSDEELMSVEDETVEMAEGGAVSGFNPAAFQPGFSFGMTGGAGQGLPSETRTFVNAQGEVRSILFINGQPIQQIPAGFVEDTPENRAKFQESLTPTSPSVQSTSESSRDRDRDRDRGVQPPQSTGEGSSGFSLSEEDSAALSEDPLAFGLNAIKKDELFNSRRLGGVGSLVAGAPGMVIGGIAGAGMELENVARARAALLLAKDRKLTDSPQYAELEKELERAEGRLSGAARLMDAAGFGSGENYFKSISSAPQATLAPMTPQAIPTGSSPRGSAGINTAKAMTPQQVQAGAQKASTGAAREKNWDGGKVVTNQDKPSTKTTSQAKSSAQKAADKLGKPMATGGRAKGGLVQRPKKKAVAKK